MTSVRGKKPFSHTAVLLIEATDRLDAYIRIGGGQIPEPLRGHRQGLSVCGKG